MSAFREFIESNVSAVKGSKRGFAVRLVAPNRIDIAETTSTKLVAIARQNMGERVVAEVDGGRLVDIKPIANV